METSASIRNFWFGDSGDDAVSASEQKALWWSKQPEVDAQMRARFASTLLETAAGAHDAWASSPEGTLALILLTDQFPRNMYREGVRRKTWTGLSCKSKALPVFDGTE